MLFANLRGVQPVSSDFASAAPFFAHFWAQATKPLPVSREGAEATSESTASTSTKILPPAEIQTLLSPTLFFLCKLCNIKQENRGITIFFFKF